MDAPASNSSAPAATTSSDALMADSTPKYVPQFSAATEMILKRISSGAGSSNLSSLGITGTPPGYEDMRRSVLMGMKTSMNMEIPSTPANNGRRSTGGRASFGSGTGQSPGATSGSAAGSRQNNGASGTGKGRKRGSKTGQKRKRAKDDSDSSGSDSAPMSGLGEDSDSDDTGSITELPRMTQSGRAVVKPAQFVPATSEASSRKRGPAKRSQEHALCKRCGRGHSPANNMIVFCDGCNLGWHQMCHDPAVSDEMVKDESAAWFCADCTLKRSRKGAGSDQIRGVSWQGRSIEDKRTYLSSLPHSQLVSLLLQACVLHPNLPIFSPVPTSQSVSASIPPPRTSSSQPPAQMDRRTNIHPQHPFPPPATGGLFSRAEANPNAQINFIRKIAPGAQGNTKDTPPPELKQSSSAPPTIHVSEEAAADGSRESTPASPPYPKPGSGLMAKLSPDDEDMEWLVDDGDFESFSHVVYGDGVNSEGGA